MDKLKRFSICIRETIATLICQERYYEPAIKRIRELRMDIRGYIEKYPDFGRSYSPREARRDAPDVIKGMAEASAICGVGPMACVAGAVACGVVRTLADAGARHIVFDNGGDIALFIDSPVRIGIYSGQMKKSSPAFYVKPRPGIFGICTSSARIGHSESFGVTDAATVVSGSVMLADAMATALGNDIKSTELSVIRKRIKNRMIPGIEGIMVIVGEYTALCGNLPEIVQAEAFSEKIAKA